MSSAIAEMVMLLVAVDAAAVVVLVPLSFMGSALALKGLARLDAWMRERDGARPTGLEIDLEPPRGSEKPSDDFQDFRQD